MIGVKWPLRTSSVWLSGNLPDTVVLLVGGVVKQCKTAEARGMGTPFGMEQRNPLPPIFHQIFRLRSLPQRTQRTQREVRTHRNQKLIEPKCTFLELDSSFCDMVRADESPSSTVSLISVCNRRSAGHQSQNIV